MRSNGTTGLECKRVELILEDRECPCCGRPMTICDHRRRLLYTFDGPLELVCKLGLTIDGLQPENGPETLYVVREVNARRVWFAQPLLSSTAAEIQPLFARARCWAESLGLPVRLWMSDKQDAFLKGIHAEFPG